MFGSSQVDTDRYLRTMGWARVAQQEIPEMNAEMKAYLEADADSVNAYLTEHQGSTLSLHCAKIPHNVTGFSFAGMIGVIISHSDRIAWGVTNVQCDAMDLYIEKINPKNPTPPKLRFVSLPLIPRGGPEFPASGEGLGVGFFYYG